MDPLTISAASGLRARLESLDLLANNIANSATAGFKADRDAFLPWLSGDAAQGDLTPTESPNLVRHYTDFSQGTLTATNNQLDFAIDGHGFFEVRAGDGPRFTRNGGFLINREGKLQSKEGYPLRVRPASGSDYRLNPALPVEVGGDGVIRQQGTVAGTIEIVDFESPDAPVKEGSSYFRIDASRWTPRLANGFAIKQGYLEGANGGAAESAVRLVSVMRQFEALQKAVTIGAEMNKRSVEEVARING
jgi:flagellar basal-body rod protein FlgG